MKAMRIYMITCLLLCLCGSSQAQTRDFQARTGFSINKKILKGFELAWSEELRMKNSAGELDRIYSALAASYEVLPWLKAGVDYTFIAVSQHDGWEFRNRSNIDITASYKPSPHWKFSLRERFRITSINTSSTSPTEANPTWIMRSRLMAEYIIPSSAFKPYAYFELSNTLNTPSVIGNYIDKIRFSAGIKYALSQRSELDFFYRYDHNREGTLLTPCIVTIEKQNNHILGLFYKYSF